MKELRMLIMNPTKPTRVIPAAQTFMVSQTSLLSGFFASRSSLEQDFRKEPSPKSTHLFKVSTQKEKRPLYKNISELI